MCANNDFKATTLKQHKGEQFPKSSNSSAKNGKMAMSIRVMKVGLVALQTTNCVYRFYIKLKLLCNSLTTDLQDYHFRRCYTCANIDFKATTWKQHKGEQFHKSSNSSAENGKMAMYLITSLESWLGGLSRKRIVHVDFTFN